MYVIIYSLLFAKLNQVLAATHLLGELAFISFNPDTHL